MLRVLILLLSILTFSACTEQGMDKMPTMLLDGFKSLTAVEEIKILKTTDGLEVIENTGLAESDTRPPFNIYTVSIPFKHLEIDGKIVFHFFNNRLMSTWFYPNDKIAYLEKLKLKGIDLTVKTELDTEKYTRVWKYIDYKNNFYVGWEDIRLRDEQHAWIARYS